MSKMLGGYNRDDAGRRVDDFQVALSEEVAAEIVSWGDSLLEGQQEHGIVPIELVAGWLGATFYNGAVAGERPYDTLFRAGGQILVQFPEGELPVDTQEVVVSLVTPSDIGFRGGDSQYPRISYFPAVLAHGAWGSLRKVDGEWRFRRYRRLSSTWAALPHPAEGATVVSVEGAAHRRAMVCIVQTGRNGWDDTDVPGLIQDFLLDPTGLVVLPVYRTADETSGTEGYTTNVSKNSERASKYPDWYFDMQAYLIGHGLSAAEVTPTVGDDADIVNDIIPRSLRADATHLNGLGMYAEAQRLAYLLIQRGKYPAIFARRVPGEQPSDVKCVVSLPAGDANAISYPASSEIQSATLLDLSVVTAVSTLTNENTRLAYRDGGAGNRVMHLYLVSSSKKLRANVSSDGTNWTTVTSTASVVFTAGVVLGFRVTINTVEGELTFYTSDDAGETWTQLGDTLTIPATPLVSSTTPLVVSSATSAMTVESVTVETEGGELFSDQFARATLAASGTLSGTSEYTFVDA